MRISSGRSANTPRSPTAMGRGSVAAISPSPGACRPRSTLLDAITSTSSRLILPMKSATKRLGRLGVEPVGLVELLDAAVLHHGNAMRQRQRFLLRMGDEDEGDADFALQGNQFDLHFDSAAWRRARPAARRAAAGAAC
jgi:hypothetical protein